MISVDSAKHIPQRTCLACGRKEAKPKLVRLVALSDGSVEIDASRHKAGRGGYLCLSPACWELGLKSRRLEYALRIKLTQENRERLLKLARTLLGGISGGEAG